MVADKFVGWLPGAFALPVPVLPLNLRVQHGLHCAGLDCGEAMNDLLSLRDAGWMADAAASMVARPYSAMAGMAA